MSAATVMRSYASHMPAPGMFPAEQLGHFKWRPPPGLGTQWMDLKANQPSHSQQQGAEADLAVVKREQGAGAVEPKSVLDLHTSPGSSPSPSASGTGTSYLASKSLPPGSLKQAQVDDFWVSSLEDFIDQDRFPSMAALEQEQEQQQAPQEFVKECVDLGGLDMVQFGLLGSRDEDMQLEDCLLDVFPSDLKHSSSFHDLPKFGDVLPPPLRRSSTFPEYRGESEAESQQQLLDFPDFSRLLDTHFIDCHTFPQASQSLNPAPAAPVLRQVISEELVAVRPTQERLVAPPELVAPGAWAQGQPLMEENLGLRLVHMLFACAEAIDMGDDAVGRRILPRLLDDADPYGDPMQRIAIYFGEALRERLEKLPPISFQPVAVPVPVSVPTQELDDQNVPGSSLDHDLAYQAMYQVLPFIKFAQFTGNQAILDAVGKRAKIHIIDLDIKQGLQWPGLLQSLAVRAGGPPTVRLTGVGTDARVVAATGRRLTEFAEALAVRLQFEGLVERVENLHPRLFKVEEGEEEGLAVNCPGVLHRALAGCGEAQALEQLLRTVHSLRPAVVTVLEVEGNHNTPSFIRRFVAALHYYSAMFDSLEATLERDSTERLRIESLCLANEIRNILVCDGPDRTARHLRLDLWREFLHRAAFAPLPLSDHALYQAKLLLGLYSSASYKLSDDAFSATLGWHDTPVVTVSAWCPLPLPPS